MILDRQWYGTTMVANLDGPHDMNPNFVLGERSDNMNGSCGVIYEGEHWIFGGLTDKNMVSILC